LKILLTIAGLISFGLGIAGMFLPILPTTPFILLAAALFARSSDKFYRKLMEHRVFGSLVRSFREEKAIPLHVKIYAVSLLWITILATVFFALSGKYLLQILLVSIATGVTIHILSYKTKKKIK
jgi:uncharacterized membrane protein YbaN (DUF454 family)